LYAAGRTRGNPAGAPRGARPSWRAAAGVYHFRFRHPLSAQSSMIRLSVNGEARRFDEALDVARLLERLELAGKKVAVERNGEIVPRSRYADTSLTDGDRLEIVVAVGGG